MTGQCSHRPINGTFSTGTTSLEGPAIGVTPRGLGVATPQILGLGSWDSTKYYYIL